MASSTIRQDNQEEHYLNCSHGIKSWLFTLDHKRIGVMYMWSIFGTFLLGGIFALLVRLELLTPGADHHGRRHV